MKPADPARPTASAEVRYRPASVQDAPPLSAFAARAFTETFGHLYPAQDLRAFLAASYASDVLASELAEPGVRCRLALREGAVVGYAMWGPLELAAAPAGVARELYRLYVDRRVQGAGVAQALMEAVLADVRAEGGVELWLSVWENNARAQAFYKRFGFEHMGEHKFMVGSVADRDFIWRLKLG